MSEAPVLVLNAGSSSLKYQLVVPETAEVQAKGLVERIGEPGSPVADHATAMRAMTSDLAAIGVDLDTVGIRAVGHRVVHGGPDFTDPTIIDDKVLEEIKLDPDLKRIPVVIIMSEASYHAAYDHCTAAYLNQAGVPNDWWCVDLCFWPKAWDVTAQSKTFLEGMRRKYGA